MNIKLEGKKKQKKNDSEMENNRGKENMTNL